MTINGDVDVKNWLIKVCVIKDLFGSCVIRIYLSNYECECDKLCDICERLDYENCKSRKKLVDKLVKECTDWWWSENSKNNFSWVWKWEQIFLNNLCCVIFNNFYNQHWN